MFQVTVPATSANVGAGFDCLGLALSMRGSFLFKKRTDQEVKIVGCDPMYCNKDNLVYIAFQTTLKKANHPNFGVEIDIDCNLPLKRGLGSSAACIVAGCVGANALMGFPLTTQDIFSIATEMEGHPDNVAPAIFGGLTLSFMKDNEPIMVPYNVSSNLHFMVVVPPTTISTQEAREILPTEVSYTDAIFNVSHCAAFLRGLETGDATLIKQAWGDRLHEPYRKKLIPEYDQLEKLCHEYQALALLISGSGSTMLVIADNQYSLSQIEEKITSTTDVVCHHVRVEKEGVILHDMRDYVECVVVEQYTPEDLPRKKK